MGADLSSETGVKNAARSYQVSESKQWHSEQSVKACLAFSHQHLILGVEGAERRYHVSERCRICNTQKAGQSFSSLHDATGAISRQGCAGVLGLDASCRHYTPSHPCLKLDSGDMQQHTTPPPRRQ